MKFYEPQTGAPMDADYITQLAERLVKSRCLDVTGAEYAVHTLELEGALAVLDQLVSQMRQEQRALSDPPPVQSAPRTNQQGRRMHLRSAVARQAPSQQRQEVR